MFKSLLGSKNLDH